MLLTCSSRTIRQQTGPKSYRTAAITETLELRSERLRYEQRVVVLCLLLLFFPVSFLFAFFLALFQVVAMIFNSCIVFRFCSVDTSTTTLIIALCDYLFEFVLVFFSSYVKQIERLSPAESV